MLFTRKLVKGQDNPLKKDNQQPERVLTLTNIALDSESQSAQLYLKSSEQPTEKILIAQLSREHPSQIFATLNLTINTSCELRSANGDIHVCGHFIGSPPKTQSISNICVDQPQEVQYVKKKQVGAVDSSKIQHEAPLRRSTRARVPVKQEPKPLPKQKSMMTNKVDLGQKLPKKQQKYLKVQEKQKKTTPDWKDMLNQASQEEQSDEDFDKEEYSESSDDSSSDDQEQQLKLKNDKCLNTTKQTKTNQTAADSSTLSKKLQNSIATGDLVKTVANGAQTDKERPNKILDGQSTKKTQQFFNLPQTQTNIIEDRMATLYDQIKTPPMLTRPSLI